ncbi:MAG: FliO/MopB family protein [Sphingomonadaceae bacterium]
MDPVSIMRTLGGLAVVLGILAGALWVVRRYDLRLPGRAVRAIDRRLELVETLTLDPRRSVALVRRDGREHVILIAPEGHVVLESAIVREPDELAAEHMRDAARADADRARNEKQAWRKQLRAAAVAAQVQRFASWLTCSRKRTARALAAVSKGADLVRLSALRWSTARLTHEKRSQLRAHMSDVAERCRAVRDRLQSFGCTSLVTLQQALSPQFLALVRPTSGANPRYRATRPPDPGPAKIAKPNPVLFAYGAVSHPRASGHYPPVPTSPMTKRARRRRRALRETRVA